MDAVGAPPSDLATSASGILLSDEDVLTNLLRGQAVQKDVQEALTSLASALSSASNPGVIHTVRRRFDERAEAFASVARATEEARVEEESRAKTNQEQSQRESTLRDEVRTLGLALDKAREANKNIRREAEGAASARQEETLRLREKFAAAEKNAGEWQRTSEAGESRLESMKAEVGALHEAMAGLHGEMGAVQRELDGAKASQDKLAIDLSRAENKIRKSEEVCSATLLRLKDAEKRLRKEKTENERVSAELKKVSGDREVEKSALVAEAKRLRESEGAYRSNGDKLSATNRDLNTLLQRLSSDLEEARATSESDAKRADASALEVGQKVEEMRRVGEALAAAEARLTAADRERDSLREALSKASTDAQTKSAEIDRQRGELELLEREKHDLILDVQERIKELKEETADAERCRNSVVEAEKRTQDEKSARLAAELANKKALDELSDARRATAMQDERIEVLRSEMATLRRNLEQTSDAAKSRDRESAQRLVQLSQANAKLSSDEASARARLVNTEDAVEKVKHELEDTVKTLARSDEEGRRAAESVQRLEEELEVADAKWKAAQGQLAAADRREKRSAEEARQKLREALESKDKEVDAALREAETNAHRRSLEAEASQRAMERNHERALATVREEAKKRLAEEETRRVREVSEARRKSKAVVGALQALQGELRNSEAKGSGLERQMSQLSARMSRAGSSSVAAGGGSGAVSNRSSGGGGASEAGSEGGKEGQNARGSEVTEAELGSLRRQMKAAIQAKESADKSAGEARSCAEEETKKRSSLEDLLCRKEGEMLAALGRLDTLKLRLQEAEENGREAEEDLRSLVRQRESEIESLTRRNQVLSDALARLTAVDTESSTAVHFPAATLVPRDDAVGRLVSSVLPTPSLPTAGRREEGESTDNRGNGFPAIPRLDGGRERVVSLGESWQSASVTSFSSTMDGGVESSLLGMEASLSVLADGSAGFEPPAPPEADHRSQQQQQRQQQQQQHERRHTSYRGTERGPQSNSQPHGMADGAHDELRSASSGEAVLTAPHSSHRTDRANSGGHSGGGRDGTRTHKSTTNDPVGGGHPSSNGDAAATVTAHRQDAGNGILHGVSAAMASGALPASASTPQANKATDANRGSFNRNSRELPSYHQGTGQAPRQGWGDFARGVRQDPDDGGGDGELAGDAAGGRDTESRGFPSERRIEDGRGVEGSASSRKDDEGERARRHIDQALRERAIRRRHSDVDVAAPPLGRGSSSLPSRPNMNGSIATDVNIDFPARLNSEFRGGTSSILGGEEEARFINLDVLAQRPSADGGPKQGLPGRGGGRVSRARSTVTGGANGFTMAATKKNASARIYGMPQITR